MLKQTAKRLITTENSITPTILRLTLGGVMFAHGAQKALGWFGGFGYDATMGFLTAGAGLPTPIAFLVIAIEFAGALALIAGLGGRVAALGIATVMVGAVLTSHLDSGFFMNWFGTKAGQGFEYHLLAIGLATGVMVSGSGAYSVDRWLLRERTATSRRPALAHHAA